jgi:pimeloyl-ACP methyl ester carboxylesterase
MQVRRGFVEIAEGQVHYRYAGGGSGPPLLMLHMSPASSKLLEPLLAELAKGRRVFAPDTLGNGDSCPPAQDVPSIEDFADATLRAADALGLERFDLYGTHTGARTATALALRAPARVRRLILDGFGVYTADDLDEILRVYAPAITPDSQGSHVFWAWQFVRDQYLFFPWFRKDSAHRYLRDFPAPELLNDRFVEVMKAITTYHKSYRAAFRYSMAANVPKIAVPTLIAFQQTDMVFPMFEQARALLPGAQTATPPGLHAPDAIAQTAAIYARFLDG